MPKEKIELRYISRSGQEDARLRKRLYPESNIRRNVTDI